MIRQGHHGLNRPVTVNDRLGGYRFGARLVSCLLFLAIGSFWAAVPAKAESQDAGPSLWHEADDENGLQVKLYLFWSENCPHCHRALAFIDKLGGDLPWLKIHLFEISDPDSAGAYQAFADAFEIEASYVPAFFYCGGTFNGYSNDETTGKFLRDTLEACYVQLRSDQTADANDPRQSDEALSQPPISVPLIGTFDPGSLSLPVMTIVLGGLDAFNPCAFFVLLFLLSLMVHVHKRTHMAIVGGTFVLFSGLLYFLFMAAWLNVFLIVGHLALVTTIAGLIALLVGAINVKDYFWFKQGISLSIPERAKPGLFQRMRGLVSTSSLPSILLGTMTLALAANAYELLCTAGFPMVFTRILTLNELSPAGHYLYLALYNLVYVLPLLTIVVIFVVTLGARKLTEDEGRVLKLLSGLMMLGLGVVLLIAPGSLSQPLIALILIAVALVVTAGVVWWRRRQAQHAEPMEERS